MRLQPLKFKNLVAAAMVAPPEAFPEQSPRAVLFANRPVISSESPPKVSRRGGGTTAFVVATVRLLYLNDYLTESVKSFNC